MKYKVKLLTQKGIIEMIISDSQNLEALQEEIKNKYGTFTMLSSTPIL